MKLELGIPVYHGFTHSTLPPEKEVGSDVLISFLGLFAGVLVGLLLVSEAVRSLGKLFILRLLASVESVGVAERDLLALLLLAMTLLLAALSFSFSFSLSLSLTTTFFLGGPLLRSSSESVLSELKSVDESPLPFDLPFLSSFVGFFFFLSLDTSSLPLSFFFSRRRHPPCPTHQTSSHHPPLHRR